MKETNNDYLVSTELNLNSTSEQLINKAKELREHFLVKEVQEYFLSKVVLYIATHNITKKKYFGKTERWFTVEDIQKYYHGSGVHWNRHLKKHSDDVTMEIVGIFSTDKNAKDYVVPIALDFSKKHNIVESKKWTNLERENGLDGGVLGRIPWNKGKSPSDETRKKQSDAKSGEKHHMYGIIPSKASNKKRSLAMSGKKQKIEKCPHCDKEGGISNMKRWHFDNCSKFKTLI